MRRFIDGFGSVDPSGSVTQAATGLAAVGIAAVLIAVSGPSETVTDLTPSTKGSAPTATIISSEAASEGSPAISPSEVVEEATRDAPRVYANIRKHAAGFDTGSSTPLGELGHIGVDVWQKRDPTDGDIVLPMLWNVTEGLCNASLCPGEQR